ncbi:hypothetical protein EVAR_94845_1 [Eumeta japonica]|uniref:Uncharacterized protein n=1 Tax=Eumeta variegata TaxID=151549 RepID=A0A4C1UHE0_EUMVA|nr:hypothetical protein EVAR_94845_1 [Eumeta japonica]
MSPRRRPRVYRPDLEFYHVAGPDLCEKCSTFAIRFGLNFPQRSNVRPPPRPRSFPPAEQQSERHLSGVPLTGSTP